MDFAKHQPALAEILKKWEDTEEAIKSAELLQGRVTVPAINELRYAGRQIIRAISLKEDDQQELNRALLIADQYLVNANHDVTDSVISFVGRRLDELNFRYGKTAISNRVPSYNELFEVVSKCKALIRKARHSADERNTSYDDIKNNYFNKVIELNEAIVSADAQMALELASYENKAKEQERSFIIAFSSLGLAVLILAAMLVWKW